MSFGRKRVGAGPAALAALILIAIAAAPAAAQWDKQSPLPTHLNVGGIAAPTASRVFLGTADDPFDEGGALWESVDGGATWVQRPVPFSLGSGVGGVFFLDALNGWLWGNVNYRTSDGGTTWTELPLLGSAYFLEFYTTTFGVTTGNFGTQISRDGGDSWTASPDGMLAFDFADASTGLGVSGTGLYRTTDGGATFSLAQAGDGDAVAYLTSSVAVGIVDGSFVRSTDAGATWTAGVTADGRNRVTAVSADVALAWAFDGGVLRSIDGGQTWTDLGVVLPSGSLAFVVPGAPTVVGADFAGNMFHSTDSGETWAQVFTSPGPAPTSTSARPAFADALAGYFAYGPGFIIKTTDGGASWAQISSGASKTILDMDRFAGGKLIAVGHDGAVVTNTDGLSPWIQHPALNTQSDLEAVNVVGATEVVAVDRSGIVYASSDQGETWTAGTQITSFVAEDLHFTTPLDGWVIGSGWGGASLFHTTDGAATWTPITDVQGSFFAVDFEGASGWASESGGELYRTTDGGATWIQESDLPGNPFTVQDMDFWDASVGYAVGSNGYAARSDDGGVTWQVLPTPDTNLLTDVYLLGQDVLWVSTDAGAAYYSATGGQNWAVMDAGAAGFGTYWTIAGLAGGDAWMAGYQGTIQHFTGPPPPPLNWPPTALYDFFQTGLSVAFTDMSFDVDGTIVSWEWDFDDSTTSTEQNPTHVFPAAGMYAVGLTVTDDDGDTGITGQFIYVQPGPGGTFGDFTEVTPPGDSLWVNQQDENFAVATTAAGDYDGDGDLDIAVFGRWVHEFGLEQKLVLMRNDGPASAEEWEFSYVDLPIDSLWSGRSDIAWGDVDGDGDMDLVLGTEGRTVIYSNDAGALVETDTVLPGYRENNSQGYFDLRSISWADYDNDGDVDLLLPSVWDDSLSAYRTALLTNDGPNGTGGFVFTETDSVFPPTVHAQSQWADYDGDQDLDLLLSNMTPRSIGGFIRRYRNDGNGVFVGESILDSLTVERGEVEWGDYDADGDLDILVVGLVQEISGSYNTIVRVYRNDAETYVPINVVPCPFCEGWWDFTAVSWADYDSDGDVDILLAGNYNSGTNIEGRAKIYDNVNGTFVDSGNQLPAPRPIGGSGGSFTWLDIDGDQDLDYFISGEYFIPGGNNSVESQMHIYRNDVQGQNLPPSAPSDLSSMEQGVGDTGALFFVSGNVYLSWIPAVDDFTPPAALTYDLDLFRDGVPVVTPRRLPEPGSISAVHEWALTGLPDGAYTWRLRAVDSAFNGGPAAEGTFAVGVPVAVDPLVALPRAYAFPPNYPNPFHPVTTFRFALPERTGVTLTVYDVAGRLVTRLVDEIRAPGLHEVRWNAAGVASGTYFVRLSSKEFTKSRKVLLLK